MHTALLAQFITEQLRNQHLEEVADLRQMLSSREARLECQKTELQQLRQMLSERSLGKERSAKVTRQDGSMTLIDRREVNTHPHNTVLMTNDIM